MPVRKPPVEAKQAAREFEDEAGKPFTLSIKEIDSAADDYIHAKNKRIDATEKLKTIENTQYDALDAVLAKHKAELAPSMEYVFTDDNGKRKKIKYGKPRITIKAAKAERKGKRASEHSTRINPK